MIDNPNFEKQFNMDLRKQILSKALLLENMTSIFLTELLNITTEKSISFGTTSSALSFNQKVHLLIDTGALSKNDRRKFQTFMEVRNQFLHNLEVNTFEKCFNNLTGKENSLFTDYKIDKELEREERLRSAYSKLCDDVFGLAANVIRILTHREVEKEEKAFCLKSHQSLINLVERIEGLINKSFGSQENTSEYGPYIKKLIITLWQEEMSKQGSSINNKNIPRSLQFRNA